MMEALDMLREKIPGCDNFRWNEFLYIPQWDVHVIPSQDQYINLVRVANKLQLIRDLVRKPITVTSGLRPEIYNRMIGGSRLSHHRTGKAVDFRVKNERASVTREFLKDKLEDLDVRMEDLPLNANWVHIDIAPVGRRRFFKP